MTAAHAMKHARDNGSKLRVVLIERGGAVGEGLAYATRDPLHLLNVPAGRMSAWPDQPDDFVRWVCSRARRDFAVGVRASAVVRRIRARDLAANRARLRSSGQPDRAVRRRRRIARRPSKGWMVHLATGASLNADAVVLAIGHRPPSDPILQKWSGSRARFISDPWRPFSTNGIKDGEAVVILGSGLTAVDAVLSLSSRGTNSIVLVSRNGLLPQAHASSPLPAVDLQPLISQLAIVPGGISALKAFRALRRTVRECLRPGAIGGACWTPCARTRPNCGSRSLWPSAASSSHGCARFGKPIGIAWHWPWPSGSTGYGPRAPCGRWQPAWFRCRPKVTKSGWCLASAKTNRLVELHADWVINCTGPAPSNSAAANPAVGSLLVQGFLHPDELGLGIETSAVGNAPLDTQGREVPDLFIVGTLRKPALWESTAVPELRQQAAAVGQQASELVIVPAPVPRLANFIWVQMAARR